MEKMITLAKGGIKERTVPVSGLEIPDLWHVARRCTDVQDREMILECWHLAHDLKRHIKES